MEWAEFTTRDAEALIAGLRAGNGPPVLLLHGGPGLGFDYLRDLAEELAEENDVAWYQQRGQAPSAVDGPHTVATDVDDAGRVLDALGWDKAYVVGHSWGGHLALHVAEALPDRVLGVLSVDPLGAVGDGRWPEFDEEIFRRTPESVRARARELDELSTKGEADDALALEGMRLVWPAYFADPAADGERALGADGPVDQRRAPEARGRVAPDSGACRFRPRLAEPDAGRSLDGRGRADSGRLGRGRPRCRSFHLGRGSRRCSCLPSAAHRRSLRDNRLASAEHTPCAREPGAERQEAHVTHPRAGVRRGDRGPLRDHQHDVASALGEEQIAGPQMAERDLPANRHLAPGRVRDRPPD